MASGPAMAMTWNWLVETLRVYPELSLFLALAIGF
jgi:hypothetical protein